MRNKKRSSGLLVLAVLALTLTMLAMFAGVAAAQTETVIHTFQSGSKMDGSQPASSLVADGEGALYGTTGEGGKYGFGSVYKLAPPATEGAAWKENLLYSFTGGADGGNPWFGALVLNSRNGTIYGTTRFGGSANAGVVYKLTPGRPWVESVVYSFSGGDDGKIPASGVIQGPGGELYGTTMAGGPGGFGVVFRLSPPTEPGGAWTESTIYAFTGGSDGYEPLFGLALDREGAIYGTTEGAGDSGSVFKLTPRSGGGWTESNLYYFNGDLGGLPNSALIFGSAGALYGAIGGSPLGLNGYIFQLTPPSAPGGAWTESTLHDFTGGPDDGSYPNGVIFDSAGALYGATETGGANYLCCGGYGTVFKIRPPSVPGGAWSENVLYSFAGGSDGYGPNAPLLLLGGTFYGTTLIGGTPNQGTVFSFTP